MLRRSRYTVTIPLSGDEYLLVNTFTGAMISGTKDFLKAYEADALENCSEELVSTLFSSGFVTELTPREEMQYAFENLESIRRIYRDHTLFILILTYQCNMRCSYCFQSRLFERHNQWLDQTMTADQVDAAFAAIETLNPDTKMPIHLFGGEPLMYQNYDLVQYILEKGESLGKSFLVVTNGLEADKFLPLLSTSNIASLQVTLDGIQEIHDSRKKKADGTGSFQEILSSIEQLAEAGLHVFVRVTFDHHTVRTLPAFMEVTTERGWHTHKTLSVYLSPVYHHTEGGCFNFVCNLEMGDLEFLAENEATKNAFWQGLEPLKKKLGFKDLWFPQISYCRHNPSQTWFDPFGDIYLCTDSLGDSEHAVGTYYPALCFNEQYYAWKKRTIFDMKSCHYCKYAPICGGGCGHYAFHEKGGLQKPDCSFVKQARRIYYPLLWKFKDLE